MKVLIVDDDIMLADLLEDLLLHQGHEVCGVATNVADAVTLVHQHRPDIAVLDVQLKGAELGTDVAQHLAASGDLAGLGILYVTGGLKLLNRHEFIGHAFLQKPYTAATLAAALPIVQNIACGRAVSCDLPHGMQLLHSARAE